jgi:uncharacterized protein (TIGR02145 family)
LQAETLQATSLQNTINRLNKTIKKMKMQMKQLLIFISIMCAVNLSAQVTIGKLAEPHVAAVLDLSQVPGKNLGLLPPGVELESLNLFSPLTGDGTDAAGMVVYNKALVNDKIYPGIYFWDGGKWGRISDGSTVYDVVQKITQEDPAAGSYWLCGTRGFDVKRTVGTGYCAHPERTNAFEGDDFVKKNYRFASTALYSDLSFIVAEGSDIASVALANPAKVNGGGNATTPDTAHITVTFVPNVRELVGDGGYKTVKIYALFKDYLGNESRTAPFTISVKDCDCGVEMPAAYATIEDNYLNIRCVGCPVNFMRYNLGADPTKTLAQQMAHAPTGKEDDTVYGALYQWGRKTDGHQKRNSNAVGIPALLDYIDIATGQVREDASDYYGKFIIGKSSLFDWIVDVDDFSNPHWDTETKMYSDRWDGFGRSQTAPVMPVKVNNGNDPCPDGWRVPTTAEWRGLFNGLSSGIPNTGWSSLKSGLTVTYENTANTSGMLFKKEITEVLFLPTAGSRTENGGYLDNISNFTGQYWSSTVNGIHSYGLHFTNNDAAPADYIFRARGQSVRCVLE